VLFRSLCDNAWPRYVDARDAPFCHDRAEEVTF